MEKKIKVMCIAMVCILAIVMVLLIVSSNYFYNVAIKRGTKDFLENNEDLEQGTSGDKEAAIEANTVVDEGQSDPEEISGAKWVESQDYETWDMISEDGLKLVAYYLAAKIATTKTAILVHGYNSQGSDMGDFAKMYYEKLGYNIFMADARGHGKSEGDYIGFGWPEREDYLLWMQKVIERVGDEAQIVLHGISMGGATVMMISGEALPVQVKVIVEDCGYTSVIEELTYQLKSMYKLPGCFILPATSLLTDMKVGYNFYEASALKQLKNNNLPILFIHGDKDNFVPTEMVWRLYDACNTEKDIYIVKGAGHGMAYSSDKPAYEEKVFEFIERFIED